MLLYINLVFVVVHFKEYHNTECLYIHVGTTVLQNNPHTAMKFTIQVINVYHMYDVIHAMFSMP